MAGTTSEKATGEDRTAALKRERDRYVALAFCWADLLFELDHNLTVVFAAGPTRLFTGLAECEVKGRPFADLVAPADTKLVDDLIDLAGTHGRVDHRLVRLCGRNGRLMTMTMAGYMLERSRGHFYLALRNATAEEKAAAAAYDRDAETGLYDEQGFAELAAQRIRAATERGEDATVSLMELPDLAAVMQRLGPRAQGRLRGALGAALRASSTGGDTAVQVGEGRYGLVHGADADVAVVKEELVAVTRQFDPQGEGAGMESATITMGDISGVSEEDLARGLLHTLNEFRTSTDETFNLHSLSTRMDELVGRAVDKVSTFRGIIANAAFDVALQPIVDVKRGTIHHFEALCRFHENAAESPYQTITFAESTGMIHEFDLAMVRKVLDWLWHMPANRQKYRAAVNVSGHSVGVEAYVTALHQLLDDNPWAQGRLLFEITESARMSDLEQANTFIKGLRGRGYEVCLDDFGAGAASFQYLSSLDVDVVKLDGSAVHNALRADKGRAFLSALTELCRRLGVETIAEMIDDGRGLRFVRDCGVDYVQGFLFGRPSRRVEDFSPLPHANLFEGRR